MLRLGRKTAEKHLSRGARPVVSGHHGHQWTTKKFDVHPLSHVSQSSPDSLDNNRSFLCILKIYCYFYYINNNIFYYPYIYCPMSILRVNLKPGLPFDPGH